MSQAWDNWERLRQDPGADPIEVLRAISAFQKYFAAIEKEAVKVARSQDRTWHEIGAALGRSRQAIWHRAAPRVDESKAADWQAWVGVLRIRGQFRLRSDTTSGCRLRNDWPVSRCPYVAGVGVCTLLSSVSHRTVYGPVVTSWYPFAPIVLASELLGSWSDLRWSRTQRKS
jgi:hypothetical protein